MNSCFLILSYLGPLTKIAPVMFGFSNASHYTLELGCRFRMTRMLIIVKLTSLLVSPLLHPFHVYSID
ncbi:hypothetical protein F4818DRAFT_412092, partial [Hypoxylon cercidicola]